MTQLMPTPMSNLRLFVAFCESGGIDRRAGLILTAAIVDSVAPASCVSDQIAAGEIVPFMQKLRQLGTTLLLDHVAKPITGQSSAPPRAYGSAFKHNLVRSSLRLERGEAGGMRLVHIKNNFGPLADTITFAMRHSFDAVSFEPIAHDDERLAGLSERARSVPDRMVDELRQFGADGASAARVAELIGSSKKTVRLSQLRQSRRVESADFGRWPVPDAVGNLPGTGAVA